MNAALIAAGALCGAGCWVVLRGLTRRHVPLLGQAAGRGLAGANTLAGHSPGGADTPAGWKARAEQWSVATTLAIGTDVAKLSKALRICNKTLTQHSWTKVTSSMLWGLAPALAVLAAKVAGLGAPWWWAAVGACLGIPGGYLLADRQLLEQADKQKAAFRGAFVAYLDLVKILLSGGSHIDGALYQAAQAGQGQAFAEIRGALDWSRVHGRPLSAGLARLGEELDLAEIREAAATVTVAETEGSSPADALAHKAETAAAKAIAEAQAQANALTERMSLPTVIVAFSFVVFIAYPALSSLSTAL